MDKKTGLVLTGGGLRGICAQTGALVALEEEGYRFDAVIGTSAGAIVGALYASHGPGSAEREVARRIRGIQQEQYLRDLSILDLLRLRDRSGITGFHSGSPLRRWLRANLGQRDIADCDPPLMISVTNVSRSFPQIKTRGPLAEFARASAAVPGLFEAEEVDGEYYVDGGATNNVPVDEIANAMPELEQILVLTTLRTPTLPEPDNTFLEDTFPFLGVAERALQAAATELSLDNLNAGDRRVEIFQLEVSDIDLDEAERIPAVLDEAIRFAREQIAASTIDLSGITRVAPPQGPP